MPQFYTFLFIAWITCLLNIPLGVWRSQVKKFSLAWFVSVHMSIPLIVIFRIHAGLGLIYIPAVIAIAILGQKIGAQILFKSNVLVHESAE